jgi:UDP-2,3-diacylglucosamine pyrophosphatase LpxH
MNSSQLEPPAVRSGVFVSDLHLFSPRSAAGMIPEQLSQIAAGDQCIVLGGDIFDFRWSIRGSHDLTLAAAIEWLHELLEQTGEAQIRFVPGNHDCHPQFLELLTKLSSCERRFGWHEHHFQLGDALFLHGDVLDARGSLANYRSRFHHEQPQTDMKHRLYDVVVGLRLHKLVPLLRHRPEITCRRLRQLIDALPPASTTPFERVFFGHTHAPVFGFESQNVRYFNPGAALKHMQAHPQHFEFEVPQPFLMRA